jgi:hypothetical protein
VAVEQGKNRPHDALKQRPFGPGAGKHANAQKDTQKKPGQVFGGLRRRDRPVPLTGDDATAEECLDAGEDIGHDMLKLGVVGSKLDR